MDTRIDGALDRIEGTTQKTAGDLTGDAKLQVEGRLNDLKGRAKDVYGQAVDGLERMVEKAPSDLQEPARRGIEFARKRPLATTGIVAGLLVLLAGAGRRR